MDSRHPSVRVMFAGSPGGHLDLLRQIVDAAGGRPRVWVTAPSPSAAALQHAGETVEYAPLFRRRPWSFLVNVVCSARAIQRYRPDVLVTSGASSVLPLAVLARATGTPVIFVETMARIDRFSRTGSVLRRFARPVLVQWPELRAHHPSAVVCRPALWENARTKVDDDTCTDRSGTLVAVGTHGQPFDRMLRAVDAAVDEGLIEGPVRAQTGHTTQIPPRFDATAWMTPDELQAAAASARTMVCHAGSGTVAIALRAGLRPIVIPRLERYGEYVADHQLEISNRIADLGLAVTVEGERISRSDIETAHSPLSALQLDSQYPAVAAVLAAAIDKVVRPS